MATIGTFTKTGNGFTGEVKTPTLNVKARITSSGKSNEHAPDFRIFAGRTIDFGAAWKKTSSEGREYSQSSSTAQASRHRSTPHWSR